nr:helix-turn-helix transcriptional regulator [Acidimicrobiia bacterium]
VEELGVGIDDVRRELADLVEADEGAFLLARAGDRDQARRLALAAASSAESKLVEAELLVLAVSCAPPGDLDAENRMAAARTLTEVGLADRALELCSVDGVEALPPVERGAVRAVAAEAAWLAGRPTEFAELISAAVEDLRGTGTAMEVQALAGSTLTQTRIGLDGRPALERAREAVALADKLGLQQGFARYRLASVLLTSGQPGWSDLYRDVIAGAEKEHDHRLRLAALESLVLGEWIAGDIDDAVAVAEGFYAEGPPPGMEASWLSFVAYGSLLSVLAGRDRAAVIDRLMSLLRDEALFRNRPYAEAALAIAFADLGRHDEAAEVLYRSAARPGEDAQLTSVRGWAFTETAWLAGRAADALEAGRGVERLGVGDYPSAVNSRLIAAYACRDLGEPVRGSEPAAAVPSWAAAPHEWRGLVAAADDRHDDAVEHFDLASAAWASHDRRSEVRAAWAAGESARLVGRDDAATRLTEAEQMALRVEQTAVAARARHSLRALGVIRGSARGAGVSGLTAREEEVLLRVGAGLTSAEIAAELHVSMSTVNSLIRSAVRRLGASNRRTAAVQVLRDRREHLGGT